MPSMKLTANTPENQLEDEISFRQTWMLTHKSPNPDIFWSFKPMENMKTY